MRQDVNSGCAYLQLRDDSIGETAKGKFGVRRNRLNIIPNRELSLFFKLSILSKENVRNRSFRLFTSLTDDPEIKREYM